MSILQEYEEIKDFIGEDRWNNIENYIKKNPEMTLDKIIYNRFNWNKFNKWYNKEIKHQKVKILGTWRTDYGDIACQAILYKDGKEVANIIESDEESIIKYILGDSKTELSEKQIIESFEILINDKFYKYLELPKISECSNLLQKIYDYVCESDASMCHVDEDDWLDWKENYNYIDNDIELLKKEIKKYGLNEVIGIDEGNYKLVGYGNLQFMFNDDRNIEKYHIEMKNELEDYPNKKLYELDKEKASSSNIDMELI